MTGTSGVSRAAARCGRLLGAVLALAALPSGAAPAAAEPVFAQHDAVSAPPGEYVRIDAENVFDDAGTNPRFTAASVAGASVALSDRYDDLLLVGSSLLVRAKGKAHLRALVPLPPDPFDVDITVEMANDEGESGTGVITFRTWYDQEDASADPAPPPTPVHLTVAVDAGMTISIGVDDAFDHAGTNPKFTGASFATMEYYDPAGTGIFGDEDLLAVRVRTSEELRALPSSPPNPFTVDVTVTMENDEGETASGTVAFETKYERETSPHTPSADDAGSGPRGD